MTSLKSYRVYAPSVSCLHVSCVCRQPYSMDGSSLCLVRADPAVAAEAAGAGSDAAVSRVKTPAADGPVRQLAAGFLSTGKKRRWRRRAGPDAHPAVPRTAVSFECVRSKLNLLYWVLCCCYIGLFLCNMIRSKCYVLLFDILSSERKTNELVVFPLLRNSANRFRPCLLSGRLLCMYMLSPI